MSTYRHNYDPDFAMIHKKLFKNTKNCCDNEISLMNLGDSSWTQIRFLNLLGLQYFQFTGSFFPKCCLTNKYILYAANILSNPY